MTRLLALLLVIVLVGGCSRNAFEGPAGFRGEQAGPGSSLAYEHIVSVGLPAPQISTTLVALRDSCTEGTFGNCSLIRFEETAGDFPTGQLVVRIDPAGVEPMVALAAEDGTVSSHLTRAEDLAKPAADASRERGELESRRTIIQEFQGRDGLSVADMIAVAQELSTIESRLKEIERDQDTIAHRVETNLLTIRLLSRGEEGGWTRIRSAAGGALASFVDGTVEVIGMAAFGIPFLLVVFPLAILWRWMWRRATRR
ncbi:MAG: DUF4349 domain-containing protein [Lysobacteraceae bacterium]